MKSKTSSSPTPARSKASDASSSRPAAEAQTGGPWFSLRYMLDAHHRLLFACAVALAAFAGVHGRVTLPTQLVVCWDAFALTVVTLAWAVISTQDPYEVRRNARLQDASATFLFTVVISAATASLLAVAVLLGSAKKLSSAPLAGHIALSVAAILLSWGLVHTLFTLRYAHVYFREARKLERAKVSGGLLFPGKELPDYLDFAYFSFVVGMTCQVSDVQVASQQMRRLVLVHGLISFLFNTAILAMFVNIVAGLI
jgi:uncharacterized membrane protein